MAKIDKGHFYTGKQININFRWMIVSKSFSKKSKLKLNFYRGQLMLLPLLISSPCKYFLTYQENEIA